MKKTKKSNQSVESESVESKTEKPFLEKIQENLESVKSILIGNDDQEKPFISDLNIRVSLKKTLLSIKKEIQNEIPNIFTSKNPADVITAQGFLTEIETFLSNLNEIDSVKKSSTKTEKTAYVQDLTFGLGQELMDKLILETIEEMRDGKYAKTAYSHLIATKMQSVDSVDVLDKFGGDGYKFIQNLKNSKFQGYLRKRTLELGYLEEDLEKSFGWMDSTFNFDHFPISAKKTTIDWNQLETA